jgi:hypothetical protein
MTKKIALFLNHPKCSIQSSNGVIDALSPHYSFKLFSKHEVEPTFFEDVDIICIPGGVGDSDSYDVLLRLHASSIRKFVASGGYYLGICMGAYWADYDYLNILRDIRVTQYIKHPLACTRRPHAKAMEVNWNSNPCRMYFYDGATFEGNGRKETIASYKTDLPMAIFQDKIGLIGCHPESQKWWYDAYSWMPKHWHFNTHKHYLLNFVNRLCSR